MAKSICDCLRWEDRLLKSQQLYYRVSKCHSRQLRVGLLLRIGVSYGESLAGISLSGKGSDGVGGEAECRSAVGCLQSADRHLAKKSGDHWCAGESAFHLQ